MLCYDILVDIFKSIRSEKDLRNIICVCKLWSISAMDSLAWKAMKILNYSWFRWHRGIKYTNYREETPLDLLKWGCNNNSLEVAQWIYFAFPFTLQDYKWFYCACHHVLYDLCKYEPYNIKIIQWVCETFYIGKKDFIESLGDDYVISNTVFLSYACECKDLRLAKYLCSVFQYTQEQLEKYDHEPFQFACRKNNLEGAKWYHKTFHVNTQGVDKAFWDADEEGHEEILSWLCQTFDLNFNFYIKRCKKKKIIK